MKLKNKMRLRIIPHIYITSVTVLFTVGFSAFAYMGALPNAALTAVCVGAYIALSVVGYVVLYRSCVKKSSLDADIGADVFHMFATKFNRPLLLLNDEAKIEWMNSAFAETFDEKGDLKGATLSELASTLKLSEVYTSGHAGLDASICGVSYRLHCFKTVASDKVRFAVVFTETNELKRLRDEYEGKRTVLAYIILDNLDSSVVPMQDEARAAAAKAQKLLYEWADESDAFIREYERDRYLVLFDGVHLEEMRENGFEILDKIRQIEIPGADTCVTASGGVSDIDGTLAEKAAAASSALETALQRGGDQIVFKSDDNVMYYGGTVKSTINASRVLARMYALTLQKLIKSADNVMIMAHRNIDYDGFGACIGLAKIAMYLGKKVNIVVNIQRNDEGEALHDRNLSICLATARKMPEYDKVFVNKAEAQDMMTPSTLLIVADANSPSILEAPDLVQCTENFVIVDHHRKAPENKFETKMMYISPTASSASEMVAEFLEELLPQGVLHKHEANLMFAGITLDTKQFSRSCSVRTYSAAQYLRRQGADQGDVAKFFEIQQEDFNKEMKFRRDTKIYKGKYAISVKMDEKSSGIDDKITAARVADGLLEISGIAASFALCRIDGNVNISARSDGKVNVSKMMEKFGGGGHFDSGGAQINNTSLEDVVRRLKSVIDESEEISEEK